MRNAQSQDILDRLQVDPFQRTFGELLREREAATHEIRRLRAECNRLRAAKRGTGSKQAEQPKTKTVFLIRLKELCVQLGVSRSTIYKWLAEGKFPLPVHIGDRAVRWRAADIEHWCNALKSPSPR